MADQAVEAPAAQEQDAQPAQKEHEERVSYDRFKQVKTENKELANQLREAQQKIEEAESQSLSEMDQLRRRLERFEKEHAEVISERDSLKTQALKLERGTWVREAAQRLNFADPADAVAFISNLEDIDRPSAAEREVKKLAEAKPHLLAQDQPRPSLGRVLQPSGGDKAQPASVRQASAEDVFRQQAGSTVLEAIEAARKVAGKE